MIRVLSVDDHPLLREGFAALVNAESDMKLVAEATYGQDAIEKLQLHHFRGSPSIRSFPREWVKLRLEHSADLSPTRLRVVSPVLTKLEIRILTHKLSLNRDVISFL